MAGHGPPPKPAGQRQRNRPEPSVGTAIAGVVPAPPMTKRVDGTDYPEVVATWWHTWSTSPQSAFFMATDWARLVDLAPVVEHYWAGFNLDDLKEMRLQEGLLGATITDRLRLRMTIKDPTEAAKTSAPERRFTVVDEATG